ncbi:MAG: D-alanine--D-alanine ligase [Patescibacteria group bacterium]|jgi:D-alanine-D-alanine ligase|nr:D-alanine--D-alanine ligase [Patescibacteria group bacterium]
MEKIKIALLSGGDSHEREVSKQTGDIIFEAMDKEKYEIFKYDPKEDLTKLFIDASTNKFDIVLPALHGTFGEDGSLQGMFDLLKVPYVFSGLLSSAVCMNKHTSKLIVKSIGISVANDLVIKRGEQIDTRNIITSLSLPIVVKPMEQGSSIGVSLVHTKEELESAVKNSLEHGSSALLEAYVSGREFTVAIMGNKMPDALPVIEIIPKVSSWFDYNSKYEDGGADEICPAVIPDELRLSLQKTAIDIYEKLGCRDLGRGDFIVDSNTGLIYFIEMNTIPGMTKNSLLPKAAKEAGISFGALLDRIIEGAIEDRKLN